MAKLRLSLVCALGFLLLMPQAAAAGGWWSYIDLNRSYVAPGQRVEVRETVTLSSSAAAEEAQKTGRFYVYLLRGFDYSVVHRAMREPSPGDWWSLGGAEAIQVGEVTVRGSDSNLGRAAAAFTMPEVPPATYHLMLCNAGCTEPLAADVIPAEDFTVAADPASAEMAQRVDHLERQNRNQARQLAAAHRDTDRALVAAQNARSEVEQLEASVSSRADESRDSPVALWAYAGWFVAGLLVAPLALLPLRRTRPSPPGRVAVWDPSDEELRELLSSGPVPRR